MAHKEKLIRVVLSRRQFLVLLVPITLATIVIMFGLISPEDLGYFSDAYTVALIGTLFLLAAMEYTIRQR